MAKIKTVVEVTKAGKSDNGNVLEKKDLEAFVNNFKRRIRDNDLPVRIEHKAGPAVGYIDDVFIDNDKLKAKVVWEDSGISKIKKNEYKYISAEYVADYKGNGKTLFGISLTTQPAVSGLKKVDLNEIVEESLDYDNLIHSITEMEVKENMENEKIIMERLDVLEKNNKVVTEALAKKDQELVEERAKSENLAKSNTMLIDRLTVVEESIWQKEQDTFYESILGAGKCNPADKEFIMEQLKLLRNYPEQAKMFKEHFQNRPANPLLAKQGTSSLEGNGISSSPEQVIENAEKLIKDGMDRADAYAKASSQAGIRSFTLIRNNLFDNVKEG